MWACGNTEENHYPQVIAIRNYRFTRASAEPGVEGSFYCMRKGNTHTGMLRQCAERCFLANQDCYWNPLHNLFILMWTAATGCLFPPSSSAADWLTTAPSRLPVVAVGVWVKPRVKKQQFPLANKMFWHIGVSSEKVKSLTFKTRVFPLTCYWGQQDGCQCLQMTPAYIPQNAGSQAQFLEWCFNVTFWNKQDWELSNIFFMLVCLFF